MVPCRLGNCFLPRIRALSVENPPLFSPSTTYGPGKKTKTKNRMTTKKSVDFSKFLSWSRNIHFGPFWFSLCHFLVETWFSTAKFSVVIQNSERWYCCVLCATSAKWSPCVRDAKRPKYKGNRVILKKKKKEKKIKEIQFVPSKTSIVHKFGMFCSHL